MSIQSVNKTTGDISLLAGSTLYADSPIGTILPFGGASAPAGWFLCDGTAVSRTTYSELFAVIGESFGAGDGSTTFNLPDMRESVPKGAGLTGHTVGAHLDADGLAVGEFLDDRVKNFTLKSGDVQIYSGAGHDRGLVAGGSVDRKLSNYSTSTTGDTTEVKSVGVNYIIKAKMVALPADFLAKVDEVVEELHVETYTLLSTTITDTHTDYTLDSNRKLSDYDYLILYQGDSTSLRNSMMFYLNEFKTKRVILSSLHGTNSSSASDYSVSTVNIVYIDDTTINAYSTGSAIINALKLVGVKIIRR